MKFYVWIGDAYRLCRSWANKQCSGCGANTEVAQSLLLGHRNDACGRWVLRYADFDDISGFVASMRRSVADHLLAFINFIRNGPGLVAALQTKNWPAFASKYNGPSYKAFAYDSKLAAAYAKNRN